MAFENRWEESMALSEQNRASQKAAAAEAEAGDYLARQQIAVKFDEGSLWIRSFVAVVKLADAHMKGGKGRDEPRFFREETYNATGKAIVKLNSGHRVAIITPQQADQIQKLREEANSKIEPLEAAIQAIKQQIFNIEDECKRAQFEATFKLCTECYRPMSDDECGDEFAEERNCDDCANATK